MAATVAQSQAPASLSSNSLTSPGAPGSHTMHDDHHQHSHQAHGTNQDGQVQPLPQTHRFEPSNFKVVRTLGTGSLFASSQLQPNNMPFFSGLGRCVD